MKKLSNSLFQKSIMATSVSAILLAMASCGGGGSSDSGSVSTVQMSGAVVDDYVAYATVYVDVNKNGKYDSEFEPSAFTDKDGYFLVAKDGTNYCENPASRNCLQGDASLKEGGVIRVETGRDLLTTQVYNATMSLLLDNNTSGLKVTAISTLNQEIENLSNDDIPDGLTKAEFKTKFNDFMSSFLGTQTRATGEAPDPNSIDPFEANVRNQARAFKMSIHFHKLAEAIAQAFVNENTNPTTQLKDFLPATYRALLLNADFSDGEKVDPLSAISTKASSIFSFVATKTSKTNPFKASGISELNKYLNCVLAVSEDKTSYSDNAGNCNVSPSASPTLAELKKSLFSAEVAKDVALEDNSTDRLKNAVAIRTYNTFDYTSRDFTTTLASAKKTASGAFNPNIGTTKVFEAFGGKNLKIANQTNGFRFFFQSDGTVSVCQKEENQYNLIKGSYAQDPNQKFVAYINVLGSTYTLKNLEPTGVSECSGATSSCIATSYRSLETNEYVQEFFADSFDLTSTITKVPTTTEQCKTVF